MMHPRSSETSINEFHDWYQNEHGPNRLRLKTINNGFRYKAVDKEGPDFMAIYDLDDMQALIHPEYTRLRAAPVQSQRERDVMAKMIVDRRFYDLEFEQSGDAFKVLEEIENEPGAENVMVAASVTLTDETQRQKYEEWFDTEHVPMLSKVPGWRRSRRFVTSSLETGRGFEILGLHEYSTTNGMGGEEFQAAVNTPWRSKVFEEVVKEKKRKVWELFYTFGPAPRDLEHASYSTEFPDGLTKLIHDDTQKTNAIESYVTTDDGAVLRYRLDGSSDPKAPAIVLINSVLVEWGIWDGFVEKFGKTPKGDKYRIVRFNSRGRDDKVGTEDVTIDLLAKDVICLLDALKIYRAEAVIGVSLGGVTALNVALLYPKRLAAFVSCDTNAIVPASNPKAWSDRVSMAEKESLKSSAGVPIVGNDLADITVKRWFTPSSQSDENKEVFEWVKSMVSSNTLHGFSKGVKALFKYDLTDKMSSGTVKGLFVSGAQDGVLPETMKKMAADYGDGSSNLVLIEAAGHLPMTERPEPFAQEIAKFLIQ
jgi:pimeloyl-ACP methyl ester carboxylesterase